MSILEIPYVWETVREPGSRPEKWQDVLRLHVADVGSENLVAIHVADDGGSRREWVSVAGIQCETAPLIEGLGMDAASGAAYGVLASRGVAGINTEGYRRRGRPKTATWTSSEESVVEGIRQAMEGAVFCGGKLRVPSGTPCLLLPLDVHGSSVELGGAGALNPARRHLCFGPGETAALETWCAALGAKRGSWRTILLDPVLAGTDLSHARIGETTARIADAARPHLFRLRAAVLEDYCLVASPIGEDASSDATRADLCAAAMRLLDALDRDGLLDRTTRLLAPELARTCGSVLAATGVESVPVEDEDAYAMPF